MDAHKEAMVAHYGVFERFLVGNERGLTGI